MHENQERNGIAQKSADAPTLVSRVIALGYYDGPEAGILESDGLGGPLYKFDLLDLLHAEDGLDLRILGLSPLPAESMADFVRILAPYQAAHWPLWCPLWTFPSEDAKRAVEEETDRILGQAADIERVVAMTDMPGRVLSTRGVLPQQVGTITDWPSFLGVNKQPPWLKNIAVAP